MQTPRETSPYSLIQEQLRDHPWKLLVAVIFLNQTSARQAKPVLDEFFKIWPDPGFSSRADREQMASIIRPIGLHNRRAETIIKMSRSFLRGFSDVRELPGIGKYGADSYNMFVLGRIVLDVEDKELKNYVRWIKERFGWPSDTSA